ARGNRPREPGDVEHGEGNGFAPGQRVADTTVKRVGTIFRETDDVRARLDARQLAGQYRNSGTGHHDRKPHEDADVEALLERRECHRARRYEEPEDPDRPVIEPVRDLVALANGAVRRAFDASGVTESLLV